MTVFTWIERELHPRPCTSDEFIYDRMESQSGQSLPIIYSEFDPAIRMHWTDRGAILDFALSLGDGHILDFGPGDGWPSLPLAPFVRQITAIDSSLKRIQVCRENQIRLRIENVEFHHLYAGRPLPIDDASIDGIAAASSVEQAPDPEFVLREFHRVLKPGGPVRLYYEALWQYRGLEQEIWLHEIDDTHVILILYDRDLEREQVVQYALDLSLSHADIVDHFNPGGKSVTCQYITADKLKAVIEKITDCRICITTQPSGKTFIRLLENIGFRGIRPSPAGYMIAGEIYDSLEPSKWPGTLPDVDRLLHESVQAALQRTAPIELDPPLTARK